MPFYITLCHTMSLYFTLCQTMLYFVTTIHIMSHFFKKNIILKNRIFAFAMQMLRMKVKWAMVSFQLDLAMSLNTIVVLIPVMSSPVIFNYSIFYPFHCISCKLQSVSRIYINEARLLNLDKFWHFWIKPNFLRQLWQLYKLAWA